MAAYKTGRSETLEIAGDISGSYYYYLTYFPSYNWAAAGMTLTVRAPWGTNAQVKLTCLEPSGTPVASGFALDAVSGYGATDHDESYTSDNPRSVDLQGTFSLGIPVEEWVELIETGTDPEGDPHDIPVRTKKRHFWKTKIGGTVFAEITAGGISSRAENTISSEVEVTSWEAVVHISVFAYRQSESAGVKLTWLDAAVESWTETASNSYGTCSISSTMTPDDKISLEAGCQASSGMAPKAEITGEISPAHNVRIKTGLRRWTASLPLGLTLTTQTKKSTWEDLSIEDGGEYLLEQQAYSLSGKVDGTSKTGPSKDEWANLVAYFSADNLELRGEDPTDKRALFRGKSFDAIEISHTPALSVASSIPISSGTPVTLVLSPAQNWGGYRYLYLDGGLPGATWRIQVGTKIFSAQADISGTAVFDLCSPDNALEKADSTDNRWETLLGDYWGIEDVASWTLTLVSSGSTTVTDVSLVRDDHALLTAQPAFNSWDFEETATVGSVTTQTYRKRFFDGDTDGKRSLDATAQKKVISDAGGGSTYYVTRTIEHLVDEINDDWPGWSASLKTAIDVSDGASGTNWLYNLLNRNRPAVWLFGGGAHYSHSNGWDYAFNKSCSSTRTVQAQELFDEVEWAPGAGDVFGLEDSSYDEAAIVVGLAKVLRTQAWGLAFNQAGEAPDPAATVEVRALASGAFEGDGTTSPLAEYGTDIPFPSGGEATHRIHALLDGAGNVDTVLANRKRRRACFRGGLAASQGPRNTPGWPGELVDIWKEEGVLHLRYCGAGAPIGGWDQHYILPTLTYPEYAIVREKRGPILLLAGTGTDVVWLVSYDWGETFEEKGIVIPGGKHPAIAADWFSGTVLLAAVVGNHIHFAPYFPGHQEPSPPLAGKDENGSALVVEDDSFGICAVPGVHPCWMLHVLLAGDTTTSDFMSTDFGLTWRRVP